MHLRLLVAAVLLAGCQSPAGGAEGVLEGAARTASAEGNLTFRATGVFLTGAPDTLGGGCGQLWPELMTVRFDVELASPGGDTQIDGLHVLARHHLDPVVVAFRTWRVAGPDGSQVLGLEGMGQAMGPGAAVGSGGKSLPGAALAWGEYHVEGRVCAGTPHAFTFELVAQHGPPKR